MGALARFDLGYLAKAGGIHRVIEAGTGLGHSTDYALLNGFSVATVESCLALYDTCESKYADVGGVERFFGLSTHILSKIEDVGRALIFLDAHFYGGADSGLADYRASATHPYSFPAIEELTILQKKPDIETSVIILDDALMYVPRHSVRWKGHALVEREWPHYAKRYHETLTMYGVLSQFPHDVHYIGHDEGYIVLLPPSLDIQAFVRETIDERGDAAICARDQQGGLASISA